MNRYLLLSCLVVILFAYTKAQEFYLGADQSYVNEMEDCGAVYKENGVEKDVYQIFADHGANLIRLRLWHTPAWYDSLNNGQRYSDLEDVKISIASSIIGYSIKLNIIRWIKYTIFLSPNLDSQLLTFVKNL